MGSLRGSGAAAVGQALVDGLRNATRNPTHFWIPESWNVDLQVPDDVTTFHRSAARGITSKLYLENIIIRDAIRRGTIDRLFSVGDTSLPFCRVPHLLLVQNAFLAYPASEWNAADARLRQKMALVNHYFRLGMRTVTHFTVQTEVMKARLAERWELDPERIAVIPSSVSPLFLAATPQEPVDPPYICFVGSHIPHKNHVIVAEVIAGMRRRGTPLRCRLTCNAREVPRLIARARELGVLPDLEFLGQLDQQKVLQLLQGAVALLIPSRLESFGLPYFEAMAAGCPVVAADRDFAHEACGDAALYANPDDGDEFANCVAMLHDSSDLRGHMVEKGRSRIDQLYRPWSRVARDYVKLIEAM